MIDYLKSLDTHLFLFLNCRHDMFWDYVMYWFSDKLIWVPMYILIAFFMIRRYKWKGFMMLLFIALLITLCDQTASNLIKNTVQRLRPSHEPTLLNFVHLSKAGAGGRYGFVSSHAANAFGLASFLCFVLNKKFILLKYWLFIWAAVVSYSRIYNGVHYPGDIIVGGIIGFMLGWLVAQLYFYYDKKWFVKTQKYLSASMKTYPLLYLSFLWRFLIK